MIDPCGICLANLVCTPSRLCAVLYSTKAPPTPEHWSKVVRFRSMENTLTHSGSFLQRRKIRIWEKPETIREDRWQEQFLNRNAGAAFHHTALWARGCLSPAKAEGQRHDREPQIHHQTPQESARGLTWSNGQKYVHVEEPREF